MMTARKLADRLCRYYDSQSGTVQAVMVSYHIKQILNDIIKECNDGKEAKENKSLGCRAASNSTDPDESVLL